MSNRGRRITLALAAVALGVMTTAATTAQAAEIDPHAAQTRMDAAARTGGGIGGAVSWYVDGESLVVEVLRGTRDDAGTRKLLATAATTARVIEVDERPTLQAANTYAGTEMSALGICSTGFAAKDAAGNKYMINTAHCIHGATTVSIGGLQFGQTSTWNDSFQDGAVLNWFPAYWLQQPAVWNYNGTVTTVKGHSKVATGTQVCHSGRTTGRTCGTAQQYNVSTSFSDGAGGSYTVSGLVKYSACTEAGDSGGPVISGQLAQGTHVGGTTYLVGGSWVCGQKAGKANVAYYQPVSDTLWRTGLTLVTG